jgi:predicted metallo-beta-lactamase superfamily hydrolase
MTRSPVGVGVGVGASLGHRRRRMTPSGSEVEEVEQVDED